MPVHPCGGYNTQSLVNILEKYYKDRSMEGISNVDKLYTIHRLDRLTSGLVILGKTSSVAQSYCKSIMNRSCRKIYLARVAGIPLHGEWKEEIPLSEDENSAQKHHIGTNLKEKATSHPACRLRKQYALACWIKDKNGKPVFEDEQDNGANILEQVFQCRHSVNDWLTSVDATVDGKEEGTDKLWFHLACPTRIAKHKDGICEASSFDDLDDDLYMKSVKPAHTSFGVVSYDRKTDSTLLVRDNHATSLVHFRSENSIWRICRPYTGRTHQIRLHLQHLSHPIANDPNYGGDIWYGNPVGRRACKIAQDRLSVIDNGDISPKSEADDVLGENDKKKIKINIEKIERKAKTSAIDVPATESEIQNGICKTVQEKEESIHAFIERTCVWCARCRSVPSTDRAILEFVIRSQGIWLHALQYSFSVNSELNYDKKCVGKDVVKSFRANLPGWHDF